MYEQDSMTPPSSPLMQHETWGNEKIVDASSTEFSKAYGEVHTNNTDDENDTIFFTCQGVCNQNNIDNDTTKHSFLKQSHFGRFLQGDLSHLKDFDDHSTVELFNCQFTAPIALDEEMDELFCLARKKISKMELMLTSHGSSSSGLELLQERVSIRQFFNYILWFLKRFSEFSKDKENVYSLIGHIKGILLHIGRLIDLPVVVIDNAASKFGNKNTSISFHLNHLHLEIHWAILEILYYLSLKVPEHLNCMVISSHKQTHSVEVIQGDLLSQTVNLLIWDIVHVALYRYKQIKSVEQIEASSFSCTCIKEVLILLRHLLMKRQEQHAGESLLMIIQPVMLFILKLNTYNEEEQMIVEEEIELNSDIYQLPPEISCSDPVGFVWWFMAGIVPILQFDINGNFSGERLNSTQTAGFEYILQQLAKKSVTMQEVHLRNHLKFCIHISKRLEANTQILSIFWDQFYKKLNDTYSLTSNPLGHLQSIKKSASDLLLTSKQIVINDPKDILHSATSYVLFLHLLCLELQKSGKRGTANQEWKSMKGRFYSKFHSRRMQELSELGLQHFSLLFLCLAEVADTQDVIQKLCDLYSTLNIATLPVKKRLAVWRGSFAIIMLHVENNTDVLFLTEKMAASFNAVASEIAEVNIEPSKYSEQWPLIDLYLESTQEIFETSEVLDLHQHILINSGFQSLLKTCRENDLRKMLHFVEAVLTKHRILCKRQHVASNTYQSQTSQKQELNSVLWKYFYTFVKEHACTLTPPQKLADLAAGFTLLALDKPPTSFIREDFVICFSYFAWNENVNSRISCRFLCHLLPNEEAMEQLVKKLPDFEKKLVQSWVKCSFELCPSNDEIGEMTRLLLKVPTISNILSGNSLVSLDDGPLLLHFISAIGSKYSLLQDLKSKTEFRDKVGQYFAEVPKILHVVLKNCSSSEGMCNIYNIAGHMAQDCSTLLYLKSKPDCLLPVLLDKLALPRAVVVQNKPIPPLVLPALKQNLHLFVKGLGRLDYRRDPYVQRKLKDIVINYMTKFSVETSHFHASASNVHPLIIAINNTFTRTVSEECSNFRRYLIDVVKSEYLALKGTAPPLHANIAWHFVLDLLNRTLNGAEIAKDSMVLLKTSLDYILVIENVELKSSASKVMQYVVENLAKFPEHVNLGVVRTIIQNFFESNMKMHQSTKVIKVLDSIAVLFPTLLIPLIKVMTCAVKASEAKRGVGLDKQLRMAYYNLLTNLGSEGNEEKSNLLRNTT